MQQWQQDQVIAFKEGYQAAQRGQPMNEIIETPPLHVYLLLEDYRHEVRTGMFAFLIDLLER